MAEAGCRRGQDAAPLTDDLAIPLSHGTRTPLQIVQPDGMKVVAFVAEPILPIDLIGERVPSEPAHRHPSRSQMHHVPPLFFQPLHRVVADAVRLTMEKWNSIAAIVLHRERSKPDRAARGRAAPCRGYAMLARRVVVSAKPALADCSALAEKAQVVRCDAVIVQVRSHPRRQLVTKRQVKR